MEATFEKNSFGKRLKSMLKVDFRRNFTIPLIYIMAAVCFCLPILVLVMPAMASSESEQAITNVWQAIDSVSGSSSGMDLASMCNINMLYFLIAIYVCVFVADEFRTGYAKNLFAVRSKKIDYVMSKSIVGFAGATMMLIAYFIGAMIGGAVAGASFDARTAGAGGIIACIFSKIFLSAVFVSIALLLSVVGKHRLWISIIGSIAVGILLFTMLSMISPLNSTVINVIICFVGGALFAVGLGAVSNVILNKTSLV